MVTVRDVPAAAATPLRSTVVTAVFRVDTPLSGAPVTCVVRVRTPVRRPPSVPTFGATMNVVATKPVTVVPKLASTAALSGSLNVATTVMRSLPPVNGATVVTVLSMAFDTATLAINSAENAAFPLRAFDTIMAVIAPAVVVRSAVTVTTFVVEFTVTAVAPAAAVTFRLQALPALPAAAVPARAVTVTAPRLAPGVVVRAACAPPTALVLYVALWSTGGVMSAVAVAEVAAFNTGVVAFELMEPALRVTVSPAATG